MSQRLPQILICDDDPTFQMAVKHSLKGKFQFKTAFHGDEALAVLKNHAIDLVLLDIQMRSDDEGLKFIRRFREIDPDLAIVMSSGLSDFETVRNAMRLGAMDYIRKDSDGQELAHTLELVLDRRNLLLRRDQQNFEAVTQQKKHVIIGNSTPIINLKKTVDRIRNSPANVLIIGETGTGKEVVARQLRKTLTDGSLAPFQAVDSSTIQFSTAESLLFGYEKGAFTGAEKTTKGIFEEAHGGIVYFDEIANMPLDIQAKLLRVLQEKEVTRLGSSKTIQLDFRVVCASNRDLEVMVSRGEFKDDLLQRLNVLPVHLPPLRERQDDIPLLLNHFSSLNATSTRTSGPLAFMEDTIELLKSYSWPGNIRELGNLVAYLAAMTDSPEIEVADLPPKIRDAAKKSGLTESSNGRLDDREKMKLGTFYDQVAGFERLILTEAYQKCAGNVSKLALSLGMDRSHLYTKLKEFGLHSGKAKS